MAILNSTPNLSASLRDVFGQPLIDWLRSLSGVISDRGMQTHLVGGMVRDALLAIPNVDIDLAVHGSSGDDTLELVQFLFDAWESLFPGLAVATSCEKFEAFFTAKIFFEKPLFGTNQYLDFATTRTESYDSSGKRPTVRIATLEEDLWRRDFSVNAMAISLAGKSFGVLVDPCGGTADIEKKQLRILNPKSFVDDPVRLLRGLRLQAKLGFTWESQTAVLAKEALEREYLRNVSPARRFEELKKALSEKHEAVFQVLQQHPELLLQISDVSPIELSPVSVGDLSEVTATAVNWKSRLITLFSATASESFFEILKQAAISRSEREELLQLHRSYRGRNGH